MQLQVSADDLRPVVTAVVTELIEQRALTPLAPIGSLTPKRKRPN